MAASAISRSIARQGFSNHHFGVQLIELQRRDPAEGTPRLFATDNQIVATSGETQDDDGRSTCRSMSHNKQNPNRVQIGHVQCFIYGGVRSNNKKRILVHPVHHKMPPGCRILGVECCLNVCFSWLKKHEEIIQLNDSIVYFHRLTPFSHMISSKVRSGRFLLISIQSAEGLWQIRCFLQHPVVNKALLPSGSCMPRFGRVKTGVATSNLKILEIGKKCWKKKLKIFNIISYHFIHRLGI